MLRKEDYKNYQILVITRLEVGAADQWHGLYEVTSPDSGAKVTNAVAGAFHSSKYAEANALGEAIAWIDRQIG